MQEVARLALDVIEADVRAANFWGLHSRADRIANGAGPGDPLPATFNAAQGARISACGGPGSNWAIDVEAYLAGTDDGYGLQCRPFGNAAVDEADVLIVRRASEAEAATLDVNHLYLQAGRLSGELFVPSCTNPRSAGCVPATLPPPHARPHELEVHAYYVATRSTMRDDLPSLRRKGLGNVNSAAFVTDEEIAAGVEDLQVRFGVDTDGDANVDAHASPGAVPAGARVVSATIWLRIRAEDRDYGHVDGTRYQYADMAEAFAPGDRFRRLVVARTVHLRNTRT
jgi:type IV pilus assembly protein PilW